ncbi:MAG: hypothetical protein MK078_04825 [Crocinitomicaceae bacterium]|nr:hypothetical protein [Crocinitomicaceae bacterium]
MKLLAYSILLGLLAFSCSGGETELEVSENDATEVIIDSSEIFVTPEFFLSREEFDTLGFGDSLNILIYDSYEDELEAVKYVDTLLNEYNDAGYVNGDDFGSLEDGKFHLFTSYSISWMMTDELFQVKREFPGAFITMLNDDKNAIRVNSKTDITIDGEPQPIVLIYADPEDEKEYFEEGGEDWMWRVADFNDYFRENHPQVHIFNFHNDYCENGERIVPPLTEDLQEIYDELDLEEAGFSFVLLKGDESDIVGYGAGVEESIVPALRFFGYAVPADMNIYWEY